MHTLVCFYYEKIRLDSELYCFYIYNSHIFDWLCFCIIYVCMENIAHIISRN
jgi:hypothetical protein